MGSASFRLGDIYCYFRSHSFDMEQGALRGHHTGTIFKIGTNYRFSSVSTPDQVPIYEYDNKMNVEMLFGWHNEE